MNNKITTETDKKISKLTVRLKDALNDDYIGSGVIFYQNSLKDKIYVFTSAHCLFADTDKFQVKMDEICVDILSSDFSNYQTIKVNVQSELLFTSEKKDVAVLILEKKDVEQITGEIPRLNCVKERSTYSSFITKGFPKATLGEEIAVLYPVWLQHFENYRFQLELKEAYSAYATKGFSGSPVFLSAENEIYLYGIFTRFRPDEKGKVIYCQYLETVNELLDKNFLPIITFDYFGNHGLTKDFFKKHIERSIDGLGPRFTEELNFKLPIAKFFNDIAKDTVFFRRFLKTVDDWVLNNGYKKSSYGDHLKEIEIENDHIKSQCIAWIEGLNNSVTEKIAVDWLYESFEKLDNLINTKSAGLYELRRIEEELIKDAAKDYSYRPPYDTEIKRLREITRNNNDFIQDLNNKVNIKLANSPCLVIKGDAGNGKSHLLGDIAKTRLDAKLPTLLMLGQNLISTKNIWENFNSELGLDCSKKDLLKELNNIGTQIGSRVLILVDAINEGGGKDLWYSKIAEFINDFQDYPYIGLVLSIRTTYLEHVIPDTVLQNVKITVIDHQGFKGNEYAALKLFCEHHGLKQPHFPLLAPEFTKPLFLKLLCEAVKETPEKSFPKGFQGISSIFKIYIDSLNKRFENKRPEYKNRKIVEKAIHLLAHACYGRERRMLLLDDAFELFNKKFPQFIHLINDLIEENVFIKKIEYNYDNQINEDVIYFAYERLGDFFIAEELLNNYKNPAEIKTAFEKGNEFGKLIDYGFWQYDGLLEAFSVLLPEKYNIEIFEAFNWVFMEESDMDYYKQSLNEFLLDSLNWRRIESIDDIKITDWLESENCGISDNALFLKLVELSPIIGHPFNSDRLFKILKRLRLPKRDSFWQNHLYYYSNVDDDDTALPIRRLIDWAWTSGISLNIDNETARLTGQTLAWILSSTDRKLRDQSTKALVNLLEQQPKALLSVLNVFKNIDDPYILERLYAVAYGCILRIHSDEGLKIIAETVYNFVFKKGNPPVHILLRDYARNTIEYAVFKYPDLKFDLELVRPPYYAKMPDYFPTAEDIDKFELKQDDAEVKKNNGRMNNMISHSVLHWDFGNKIVDSNLGHFYSVPFSFEENYKSYLKTLDRKQRGTLRHLNSILKTRGDLMAKDFRYSNVGKKALYEEYIGIIEEALGRCLEHLKNDFSASQLDFLEKKIIPVLEKKYLKKNRLASSLKLEKTPIRRWIVNRVFELGYNHKIHGFYDRSSEERSLRSGSKTERIGKKYQWIALFEILARIADNYKIYDDWSGRQSYYKGPWQLYSRDIDPVFTKRSMKNDDEKEVNAIFESLNWWDAANYNNWNQNDAVWAASLHDLPSVRDFVGLMDDEASEWLVLERSNRWEEPKPMGQDHYFDGRRKDVSYFVQAYIINKKDKTRMIKRLEREDLNEYRFPESPNPLQLFNREKFWSPIYSDVDKEKKWRLIEELNAKVIVASTDAVGEMANDKSEAHCYYDMPCRTLFEGMELNYGDVDGEFKNKEGQIVAKDIDNKNLIVKKSEILPFLERNKLDILWILTGEKLSFSSQDWKNSFRYNLSGVFYLNQANEITGNIVSTESD
ncbi:AVAST type 2 anti-phage system protein Avs2 [Flavobacterium luteolum]|uniref:AVAST type 2 anti-phage system protein Avs2 n=1 Tax=Flavobacterium luteolum TaxID=3003259 RepID=UPI00248E4A56|nr:AVAST type 2 anti-phage system protein Avs2 [Flavobacterium luteolum]